MTPSWALDIPIAHAAELGRLRLSNDLQVLVDATSIWLRGSDPDALASLNVTRLPAAGRYRLDENLRLIPLGKRLPVGALPDGEWTPLRQWFAVVSPPLHTARPAPRPHRAHPHP